MYTERGPRNPPWGARAGVPRDLSHAGPTSPRLQGLGKPHAYKPHAYEPTNISDSVHASIIHTHTYIYIYIYVYIYIHLMMYIYIYIYIYIIKWIIGSSWWIPGMFGVTHYLNQPRLIWIIGKINKTNRSIRRMHRKMPSPKPRSDWNRSQCVNTLRPRQNGRPHTHDTDTVRSNSLNDFWIWGKKSLKCVPWGVQLIIWQHWFR